MNNFADTLEMLAGLPQSGCKPAPAASKVFNVARDAASFGRESKTSRNKEQIVTMLDFVDIMRSQIRFTPKAGQGIIPERWRAPIMPTRS